MVKITPPQVPTTQCKNPPSKISDSPIPLGGFPPPPLNAIWKTENRTKDLWYRTLKIEYKKPSVLEHRTTENKTLEYGTLQHRRLKARVLENWTLEQLTLIHMNFRALFEY